MTQDAKNLVALVWKHAPSRHSGTALVVLLKLAALTCKDGHAFPSVEYLAAACGTSGRAIQYCLRELRKDGLLKIVTRRGRSSHFFLQADALRALPLAIPTDDEETAPETTETESTAAQTAPAQVIDARWLANALHVSIRREIADAVIPDDWQVTWATAIQQLLDAGHSVELIRAVARFALAHEGWATTLIGPRGALGFAEKFDAIQRQYVASNPARAAA